MERADTLPDSAQRVAACMRGSGPLLREFDPADLGHAASPCIGVCVMNAQTGWCEGCFRTIDEIAAWAGATDAAKRAVWAEIKRRAARIGDGTSG